MNNVDRALATVLAGFLLASCGACSRPWRFAQADYPMADPRVPRGVAPAGQDTSEPPPQAPLAGMPGDATSDVLVAVERPHVSSASRHSAPGTSPEVAAGGPVPASTFESCQGPVFDPAIPLSDQAVCAPPGLRARLRSDFWRAMYDVRSDYGNYYCCITMRDLWLGVGAAAVVANTSLDEDFQGWYQRDVRSSGTDDFASFWKTFGEGWIFVPAYAGLGLVGGMFEDRPLIGEAGEFGDRVTRGYVVGVPPMLFMQYLLGASRPGESGVDSQWKPFDDDNGVAGHAFVGALPFITAAKMCENRWMKCTLYVCSTFTAWSRVNDDAHYLSQACLGWWMAYLACRAVDDTEQEDRCFTFTPLVAPGLAGAGVEYRW